MAIEDLSTAIHTPNITQDLLTEARGFRGVIYFSIGDNENAKLDLKWYIDNESSNNRMVGLAHAMIAAIHSFEGNIPEAITNVRVAIDMPYQADVYYSYIADLIAVFLLFQNKSHVASIFSLITATLTKIEDVEQRNKAISDTLIQVAKHGDHSLWLTFHKHIKSTLPNLPDIITLLEPIARFIETNDASEIERLPADQRTVVDTILEKFESSNGTNRSNMVDIANP